MNVPLQGVVSYEGRRRGCVCVCVYLCECERGREEAGEMVLFDKDRRK